MKIPESVHPTDVNQASLKLAQVASTSLSKKFNHSQG
jgi:hypothetical protein